MKKIYLLFFVVSCLGISAVKAQYTDLHDFNNTDGLNPYGSLIMRGDTLYGMSAYGGYGAGNVFSVWKNGSHYIDLYDFSGGDGAYPYGSLTLSITGDTLYGMTSYAGAYGNGDIFAMAPDGSWFTDIYDFPGSSGGAAPYGSLLLSITGDTLWGESSTGGTSSYGNVFCIQTNGSGYYDVLDFNTYNGAYPYGSLIYSKGKLFGMASEGGYYGYGSIIAINPTTLLNSDIYDFDGTAGYPYGSLTTGLTGDTLFGMTSEQGFASGNVFGYILGGGGYIDLYDFSGIDGYLPEGDLTLARSGTGRDLFYGMTNQGGINGYGNLFSIKTNGSHYTDLYDFSGSTTSGAYPYGDVTFLNDTMYGMTSQGGANNDGVIFDYTILTVSGFKVANVTCTSMRSGSASAIVVGGVTPYTYLWSPGGQTTQTINGLSAGSYTVIVTDNVGSHAASVAVISGVTVFIRNLVEVTCNGGNNGIIVAGISRGTAPYLFSWSDGTLGSMDRRLSAGTYTVTVTDSCGMTATASATITQPPLLSVFASLVSNVYCSGGSDGSVSATSTGGDSPYTYLWSDASSQTTATATGLTAGMYYVTVSDTNGCSAIDSVIVNQPSKPPLGVTIARAKNVDCEGGFDGMALALPSGGEPPYTYNWSPGGQTTSLVSELSAGIYTVEVTDSRGCTASISANITEPAVLTVSDTTIMSLVLALPAGGTPPYTFTWTPGGSTSALVTGISAGTYTVIVTDANSCQDSAVVDVKSPLVLPPYSALRSPRWSKRGMYVEWAAHYYNPNDSLTNYGTPLVTYCKLNKITYVLLDGVDNDATDNPIGPFYLTSAAVNPTYAGYLANFIDSLKTRGGVEQVGVVVYNSAFHRDDTNSFSVRNYDVANYSALVSSYNIGIPWVQKIDVISLDEEFWETDQNTLTDTTAVGWQQDLADFDTVHLPMLRSMWNAAHSCDKNFLRVEDYIAPDLNPMGGAVLHEDSLYTNWVQAREIDSISKYTDRILLSSYTSYPEALWNRGDWIQGDSEIGRNPIHSYYKKEIWPVFDPANLSDGGCPYCADQPDPEDFLGGYMCSHHVGPVYMEQRYYDSLTVSWKKKIFTNNLDGYYAQDSMKEDTCFKICGSMWFQYACLKNWKFEDVFDPSDTAIQFEVTLWHDTLWTGSPITLTATPHGGTPPFVYIWYDEDNNDLVVRGADTSRTFIATYPSKYSVLAVDLQDSAAYDYINVYSDTCFVTSITSITQPNTEFKVYPNPASSLLNIKMLGEEGDYYFRMYDVMGQLVKTDKLTNSTTVLNISSLSDAMYFYQIIDLEGKPVKSDKLVIMH